MLLERRGRFMLRTLRLSMPGFLVVCLASCGSGGGGGDNGQPTPPQPPSAVASVTVLPGEFAPLTLIVGASQQLTAITRDQAGSEVTGRAVTWETSNPR